VETFLWVQVLNDPPYLVMLVRHGGILRIPSLLRTFSRTCWFTIEVVSALGLVLSAPHRTPPPLWFLDYMCIISQEVYKDYRDNTIKLIQCILLWLVSCQEKEEWGCDLFILRDSASIHGTETFFSTLGNDDLSYLEGSETKFAPTNAWYSSVRVCKGLSL